MSVSVDIEKKLGSFLLKVAFEAGDETLALLGASGCGKSMTLKCIAGIEKPDRGRIAVDGNVLFDSAKGINLRPQRRYTGLMFQNYSLFPNMTVLQNILAGARREKDRAKREASLKRMMDSFGLSELANRYPHQLSGGQQQRTALAKILISSPRILLLDEPFSALDSHLRFRLEQEVKEVIRDFGKTVLLVSHDRDEVFRMSDSVAVMNEGKIDSFGDKHSVFADPKTRTGAVLTGCKNISRFSRLGDGLLYAIEWGINLKARSDRITDETYLGIRMHDIRPGEGENSFRCRVISETENPFSYTVMLSPVSGDAVNPIGWETDKDTWAHLRADTVSVCLPPDAVFLLKE